MISQFAYATPSKLLDRLQRLRDRRRSRAELDACSPGELHRIARDVGLTGDELRSLDCSHTGPSELMPRRLDQLGLDSTYVKNAQAATYRDLERVCAACKAWRRCARDLARGDAQAGMTRYCLNAPTIDALVLERAR